MLVACLSLGAAYWLQGALGLSAALAGVGIAFLMCASSGLILRWASRARGQAILAGMLGSVAASFVILIAAMLILGKTWRPALEAASLTALATYLGYRFIEAFQFSALLRALPLEARAPGEGG